MCVSASCVYVMCVCVGGGHNYYQVCRAISVRARRVCVRDKGKYIGHTHTHIYNRNTDHGALQAAGAAGKELYIYPQESYILQHTATHCSTLQHTATHCNRALYIPTRVLYTPTRCNTLQHIATHCNTLQNTATHCITLPHKG